MSPEQMIVLVIAVASISFKPGPGMAAIVARAIAAGFVPALMVSLGAIVVEVLYFLLAVYGFGLVEAHLEPAAVALKIIGIAYLCFLGYKAVSKTHSGAWEAVPVARLDDGQARDLLKNFGIGVVVTLGNPLVILFYAALVPTILDMASLAAVDVMIASTIIIGVHSAILSLQCALAVQLRIAFQDRLTLKTVSRISGLMMFAVAGYIFYDLVTTASATAVQ